MAKKKKAAELLPQTVSEPVEMPITRVIETNYMPYAMTCIVGRAIPDIDGFKPAHRKLLYTMYKMGLLTSENTTKSAKVVGQTMMLNPHGDASIYETLAAMTTGKEAQLHAFIKSKGTFGKHYSDTACSAARYTECKLAPIAAELFDGIDEDAVDFEPNYDNTTTEPVLLPVSYPNVLAYCNVGIAVSMKSDVCSFNLKELCDATAAYLKNENITIDEIMDIMPAPDFSTGADILYDVDMMKKIYETGVGSIRLRAKYTYDEKERRIIFTEIPYEQKVESIRSAIINLVKAGKIADIVDVRDEIGIDGLRLAVDLKKGADKDRILAQLFKMTKLQSFFSCNFIILVGGLPRLMGVKEIIEQWVKFRIGCLRRIYTFRRERKTEKLHLLLGLREILLDIDKAIAIIRETKKDAEVVPNLMAGFGIDETQAEFVANIKLRYLNREYIVKRTDEIASLEDEIAELTALIGSDRKIKNVIIKQLGEVSAKYGIPRKTGILFDDDAALPTYEEVIDDSPITCFFTREGYFKKCLSASMRTNDRLYLKENDTVIYRADTTNTAEILFFTSLAQVYKSKASNFESQKLSVLGEYVPAKLSFESKERAVYALCLKEYVGNIVLFFANGKAVRIPANAYETKQNRKKLTKAFYVDSPLVAAYHITEPCEFFVKTDGGRAMLIRSDRITEKTTRTSSGGQIFTLKAGQSVVSATVYDPKTSPLSKESKYRKDSLPSTGAILLEVDDDSQQTLLDT